MKIKRTENSMLENILVTAAVIFGPLWHFWIAVIFRRTDCREIYSSIG